MIRNYKNSAEMSKIELIIFTVIYVIFALAVFVPVHLLSEKRAARLESIGKENIYRKSFCVTLRIILGAILYVIGVRLHKKK